jgi:hypothetical protein
LDAIEGRKDRMKVRRTTARPEGNSVSYTQLSQFCGLRLKFKRQKVKDGRGTGIFLLYGRALHAGIEASAKGRARTDEEAVKLAVASLRYSISAERKPVEWDDPLEHNKDGSVSAASFGNLHDQAAAEWWLERQVALYLRTYPEQNVDRSEHRIFVPISPPEGVTWTRPWSLECWLDREMKDGSIHDIKSAGKPWSPQDVRKGRIQALIYMAAYWHFYQRQPSHFEFHVLPRQRGEGGEAKLELQVVRVDWDSRQIQAYIDSVIKPQITVIEQETYVANPASSLCSERWCSYWQHCSFGAGDHV